MIGIICALKIEVDGIIELMEEKINVAAARMTFTKGKINGKEIVAVECGIGKVNAAICTQIMIDLFNPSVIINSGIAGSLSNEVGIGDIVIAKDVVQHDMDGTATGDPPGEIWFNDEKRIDIPTDGTVIKNLEIACKDLKDTKTVIGRIATGDVFVAAKERRHSIHNTFGAMACEMEGGAIGQVCYRNGIPFGIIRCISDDIDENEFVDFMKFREIAADKSIFVIKKMFELL